MHSPCEHQAKVEPKHAVLQSEKKAPKPVAPRVVTLQAVVDACTQRNPASAFQGVKDGSCFNDTTFHTAQVRQNLENLYASSWDKPIRAGKLVRDTDCRHVKRIKRALHVASARRDSAATPPVDVPSDNLQQDIATSSSSRPQQQSNDWQALEPQQLQQLQVISRLWQLYTEHQAAVSVSSQDRSAAWLDMQGPRLLTEEEEQAVGSIVQQHLDLLQLYKEHPQLAVSSDPVLNKGSNGSAITNNSSSSLDCDSFSKSSSLNNMRRLGMDSEINTLLFGSNNSSSSSDSSNATSGSSSNADQRKRRSRYKLREPLTAEQVSQLLGLSPLWRAMLPSLAEKAQQLLAVYNIGLVKHMLQYVHAEGSTTVDDLYSAGMTGLRKAVLRYNPTRGTRFSTVGCIWVLTHLQKEVRVTSGNMQRPKNHYDMMWMVRSMFGQEAVLGIEQRPDVVQQVAKAVGLTPGTVLTAIRDTARNLTFVSLDAAAYSEQGSKADFDVMPSMGSLLTSSDLDEGHGDDESTQSDMAGQGSFQAASGQVPAWAATWAGQDSRLAAQDVAEAAATSQLQQLMQVLTDSERILLDFLYKDGAAVQLALQNQQGVDGDSSSSSHHSSSSSSSSNSSSRTRGFAGHSNLKGNVPVTAAVKQLGYKNLETARLVRRAALEKLKVAALAISARTAAAAAHQAALPVASSSAPAPAAAAAATADAGKPVQAEYSRAITARARQKEQQQRAPQKYVLSKHNARFVQQLVSFREQHGRLPAKDEVFEGRPLGRQLFLACRNYCYGKLGVALTAAVEAAMGPDWDWSIFERPASKLPQVRELLFQGYLLVLQSFVAEKGYLPGRQNIWQGVRIGQWVFQQQRAHRRQQVLQHEVQLLEQVPGWTWQAPKVTRTAGAPFRSSEAVFEHRLALLRQFQAQHAGALPDLSRRHFEGVDLLKWMMRMWCEHRKGNLAPHRVAALESVPGWTWDTGGAGREHSSSSSSRRRSSSGGGTAVGGGGGGGAIKGNSGSREPSAAISVGSMQVFAMQLQRLQEFAARHGHPPTPASDVAPGSIGSYNWVCQVRAAYRQGQLSQEQVKAVEAVPGWSWTAWEYNLVATRQFVAENGRLPRAIEKQWGKGVGPWCSRQRRAGRDGKLTQAQMQQLEALPGWKWR